MHGFVILTSLSVNSFEAQRRAGILDARLAKQKYMLGDTYTIVDMNVWGWARLIPTVLGDSPFRLCGAQRNCRTKVKDNSRSLSCHWGFVPGVTVYIAGHWENNLRVPRPPPRYRNTMSVCHLNDPH